jgi:hypothetical protein
LLAHFNVGAGIVADSHPEAEYEETLAKAAGFLAAIEYELPAAISSEQRLKIIRGNQSSPHWYS